MPEVNVQQVPEYWSAWDDVSNVFGIGNTPADAIRDYEESLAEQLAWFKEHEHTLGQGLAAEYEAMKAAGMVTETASATAGQTEAPSGSGSAAHE